jgi:hypothetical protein
MDTELVYITEYSLKREDGYYGANHWLFAGEL